MSSRTTKKPGSPQGRLGVGGKRGELEASAAGKKLFRQTSNLAVAADGNWASAEEEAAHEAIMQEHARQRNEVESEESVHRQRHQALQAVATKFLSIEALKFSDPDSYQENVAPCACDDVARRLVTVKLMTSNRAMKPFSISVPLPNSDYELESLTLGEFKEAIFEAAKTNFVDPVMLPLLQPHMQALYNLSGKQIGRVDDKEAMDRWLAAHPPPTKKLTAAEKAALPVPPPMPTVESVDASVKEFGVIPGATIYLAIRVAATEVVGTDAHACGSNAQSETQVVIAPINPKDLKQQQQNKNKNNPSTPGNATNHNASTTSATGASPSSTGSPSPAARRR